MKIKKILSLVIVLSIALSLGTAYPLENNIASDPDSLKTQIINKLYNRDKIIKINYKGNTKYLQNTLTQILNSDPYINYSIKGWKWSFEGVENDIDITIDVNHLVNKSQEIQVDKKIDEILSQIIKEGMSPHEKAKIIHDFIVNNTSYDTDYEKFSHYDALFDKESVCNGYALLAYKMYEKAGFNIGFVEGVSNGENHIWNTINISGYTYHIDLTWDDPVPDLDYPIYSYYMLTDKQISKDHQFSGSYSSNIPYGNILNVDISSNIKRYNQLTQLIKNIGLESNYKSIDILLNGKKLSFDQAPVIQKGRTLVPFRTIYENFGMDVDWDPIYRKVFGFNKELDIVMQIDNSKAYVNNLEFILDSPPIIVNSRTLVPVRFISESMGKNVKWDDQNRQVIIQ